MNYEDRLRALALQDDRVVVLTAENRALVRSLPAVLGRRFIDTGITEQTLVGVAAGLALRGRIPIVHALATFLTMRAFEFIRTDAGIPALPIKLSGFVPGFLSDGNGPTHQALEDVSLMRGIPHMEVYAPADQDDLLQMLPVIWQSPNPAYIRINTRSTNYTHDPVFVPGKAEVVARGTDVTILTYGMLFEQCLIAHDILKTHGVSAGLINMRSLKPVDASAILEAAASSGFLVTVEDHFQTGGLYSIAVETLFRHGAMARILPLAFPERWYRPGRLDEVLAFEGFTGKQIAEKILGRASNAEQPAIAMNPFAE